MRGLRWMNATLAVCALWVLGACGQAPPPLEQVESDLKSPSGTVSGPMISASYNGYLKGQVALKLDALNKYGQLPQFLEIEDGQAPKVASMQEYLTRSGIPAAAVKAMMPYLPVNNDYSLRKISKNGELGTISQPQLTIGCYSGDVIGFANIANGKGSAELSIDLGCLKEGSGRVVLRFVAEGSSAGGKVRFEVFLQNVCDTAGNCVDGGMIYNAMVGSGAADMLMSMYFKAKTAEGETAEVKQGMRISADASKRAGKLEVLTYARDVDGKEYSIVMGLQAQGDLASFTIRGNNGEFSCSTSDAGKTGSCTATNGADSVTWTRN
ncbi:MAG: hypothetical protein H6727_09715 [Myxococcales bacterium]|nr:hypothetical protein [Myxococcales bacterium]